MLRSDRRIRREQEVNSLQSYGTLLDRKPRLTRFLMALFAVLVSPALAGLVKTFFRIVVKHAEGNSILGLSPAIVAFILGMIFYLVLFIFGVRPTKLYVIGHELTHGLFAIIHGAKAGKIKIDENHGSIELSRAHAMTILAPYYFPFYMALITIPAAVLSFFVPLSAFLIPLAVILGITWGFHLCYTVNGLLQFQTDLEKCGYFFSYVMIIMMNTVVLTAAAMVLAPCSYKVFSEIFGEEIYFSYVLIIRNIIMIHDWIYSL